MHRLATIHNVADDRQRERDGLKHVALSATVG